jgi:hypothetical protein
MVASLDDLSDVVESKLHGAHLYCNKYIYIRAMAGEFSMNPGEYIPRLRRIQMSRLNFHPGHLNFGSLGRY